MDGDFIDALKRYSQASYFERHWRRVSFIPL